MKKAFTLVEMMVVLVVIAAVAHLAVRELGRAMDSRRERAAGRQLEEIRAAVWSIGADGEPRGFLADTGLMPRAADGTLSELWRRPDAIAAHSLVAATAANLRVPENEKAALADASVLVPAGWRGPYIDLPFGKTRLRDPWGNPVETPDAAGLSRIWTTNGAAVAVSHYGADALARSIRTVSLLPEGECTLAVTAEFPGDFAGEIVYKWYGPCGSSVTGGVAKVAYPAAAVFRNLTPGVKILKDSVSGAARRIVVRPGGNLVHLKLSKGN